jgi:hypothetical protein
MGKKRLICENILMKRYLKRKICIQYKEYPIFVKADANLVRISITYFIPVASDKSEAT